jgi:hypothetical protein
MVPPNFEIRAFNGMRLPIKEYDPELTVKELIDMVVDHLDYPLLDDDQKEIEYFLEKGSGERLPKAEPLARVGVQKDEVLELKASTSVAVPDRRARPLPPPAKGMVNVYVQLLDLNRTELETFSVSQKVGEVLNEIIRKYGLPARDERLKEGKIYELFSKTAGDAMHEGMTLAEAKIPNQDTFIISTKEIPG